MYENDKTITLTVIHFIGTGFVLGISGLFALALRGFAVPEGLTTIVGGLGGALGALLANTRGHLADSADGAGPPSEAEAQPAVGDETK